MPTGRQKTDQQIVLDSCETSEDYYNAIKKAKINNSSWARDILFDQTTERAKDHKCIHCGNPNMDDSMSGSECKRCGIKRLEELYGMTKEKAIEEYEHRIKRKIESEKEYVDFASKLKKDDPSEVDNLPF